MEDNGGKDSLILSGKETLSILFAQASKVKDFIHVHASTPSCVGGRSADHHPGVSASFCHLDFSEGPVIRHFNHSSLKEIFHNLIYFIDMAATFGIINPAILIKRAHCKRALRGNECVTSLQSRGT